MQGVDWMEFGYLEVKIFLDKGDTIVNGYLFVISSSSINFSK